MPDYQWITEQIFTVADFYTPEECAAAIEVAEGRGFSAAPINSTYGPEIRQDVRNNERVMIDDPDLAAGLYGRIGDYVPRQLGEWTTFGVNERFRYYRYDVGQQFNWHYDGAFERANGERSKLTFMIYLNDDFLGGQTSFEGRPSFRKRAWLCSSCTRSCTKVSRCSAVASMFCGPT